MHIPQFSAEFSLYSRNRSIVAEFIEGNPAAIVPQLKVTTQFCGACTCRTVGGCGVGPYNPGWQNCVEVDTHDSWNIFGWDVSLVSVPCFGAKSA
jgi:hypothetical protein